MGTERKAKDDRRTTRQILRDFGIDKMQASLQELSSTIASVANSQANVTKKHDDLVKKLEKELTVDLLNGGKAGVSQVLGWRSEDIKTLEADRTAHGRNLRELNEVRNRGLLGRLKWLATGR